MKTKLKAIGAAILAAVTSPTAVKAEKTIGVLIAVRILQAVGASAGLVYLVQHLA